VARLGARISLGKKVAAWRTVKNPDTLAHTRLRISDNGRKINELRKLEPV